MDISLLPKNDTYNWPGNASLQASGTVVFETIINIRHLVIDASVSEWIKAISFPGMSMAKYVAAGFDQAALIKRLLVSKDHPRIVDVVLINPVLHKGLFDDPAAKELILHVLDMGCVIYILGEPSENIK